MQLPPPFLLLLSLAACAHAQSYNRDWRTASDCIQWEEVRNATEKTCDSVLRKWELDPERFHAWNPAVGLDCTPWPDDASYCVLTNATLEDAVFYTTTTLTYSDAYPTPYTYHLPLFSLTTNSAGYSIPVTRSDAPVRSTSTRPPIPAPTAWKNTGCFVNPWNDDFDLPRDQWIWILDYRFVPSDPLLTVDKCKQRCWEIQYPVAGLKDGSMCYCGDRNNGTVLADQAECALSCPGGGEQRCGGVNRTSVWEADGYVKPLAGASLSGSGSGAQATATATSGAVRNAVLFGLLEF